MGTLRTAAVGAGGLLATRLLGGWAVDLTARGVSRVDEVVALGAAGAGALLAAWYALTATALLLLGPASLGRRAPRLTAPLWAGVARFGAPVLRRAAAVGVGAGLALGALPAGAADGPPAAAAGPFVASSATPPEHDEQAPLDLRPGLALTPPEQPSAPGAAGPAEPPPSPLPTEDATAPPPAPDASLPPAPGLAAGQTNPSVQPAASPAAAPGQLPAGAGHATSAPAGDAEAPAAASHNVRAGDTLWSITAARLGPEATDFDIAAEWPRWYAANRALIGADPDLIHPGQELLSPDQKDTT